MQTELFVKRSVSRLFYIGMTRVNNCPIYEIERTIPELKETMRNQILKEMGVAVEGFTVSKMPEILKKTWETLSD